MLITRYFSILNTSQRNFLSSRHLSPLSSSCVRILSVSLKSVLNVMSCNVMASLVGQLGKQRWRPELTCSPGLGCSQCLSGRKREEGVDDEASSREARTLRPSSPAPWRQPRGERQPHSSAIASHKSLTAHFQHTHYFFYLQQPDCIFIIFPTVTVNDLV